MEKLMKPAEYAKELGISRQAVYAKIKRGMLTTKQVEGKIYIVVDNKSEQKTSKTQNTPSKQQPSVTEGMRSSEEHKRLLDAKDETISVLKGTVEDLKESNRQMSSTLKSEIDLLKAAFSEMRTLYVHRIEQMKLIQPLNQRESILDAKVSSSEQSEDENTWIGPKKFFKTQEIIKEKQKKRILKRLKKALKKGDNRISEIDGKLKIDAESSYNDIIEE